MAHCRLLFVGTKWNMEQIYANCSDSSSETSAEMAFGCDYTCDDFYYKEEFTKQDKAYEDVINGYWVCCYDIRDINHYADYACLHKLVRFNKLSEEEEYKAAIIQHIKSLPDDTIFFFQDSHW